ncbi:MAG: HEAT repeat domain-containing protein [Acidobacteriota bacterium]|nr:MAG: HEAT repeat domain-containing protein [Acidobacteriota bacterium]
MSSATFAERLLRLVDVRRGEGARVLLGFGYLFLIITCYVILKAVRDGLFIAEFGAIKLPWVMHGIAVLAGTCASAYVRLSRDRDLSTVISIVLVFFASNVALFWWFAQQGHTWLFPVLYIWAGVFGVIAPTQVWTLLGTLFTTRQAKRLFGVIGAGGILGGFVGGQLANWLVDLIGAPQLLLLVVGLLLIATVIVTTLRRLGVSSAEAVERSTSPRRLRESLSVISQSRHLRVIAILVFVTAVATQTIDWQFKHVVEQAFETREQYVAFFGKVYSIFSILAFAVQVLLTSRLFRHLGLGASLLILPIAVLAGSIELLIVPSLWAAVMLKGADGTFKHSLDRSCREMMYLPVAAPIRVHAKATIDTVFDRFGDGSAGLLLLLLTAVLGWELTGSLLVNILIVGCWALTACLVRRHYVDELRHALGRPTLRLSGVVSLPEDADTRRVLERVLADGSESEKLGALEIVAENPRLVARETLRAAACADSKAVRRAALAILVSDGDQELPPELADELEQEGQQALVSTIDLLLSTDPEELARHLDSLLGEAGRATKLSSLALMLRWLGPEFEPFGERVFDKLTGADSPIHARRAAAQALALIPRGSPLQQRLGSLLEDPDPAVVSAACESAGRTGRVDLLGRLVELLGRPRTRRGAARGLRALGARIVPQLAPRLLDSSLPSGTRGRLAQLMGEIGTPEAMRGLASGLDADEPGLVDCCLEALSAIRLQRPDLHPLTARQLTGRLRRERDRYERLLAATASLSERAGESPAIELLHEALEERSRSSRRSILRWAGLWAPPADVQRAAEGLEGAIAERRANAIELLDNTLPRAMRQEIVRAFDHERATSRSSPRSADVAAAFAWVIESGDPWLVALALHAARGENVAGLETAASRLAEHRSQPVREEARAWLAEAGWS